MLAPKKIAHFLILFGVGILLQGCGGSSEKPPGAVLQNVSFAASLDANENTAVSMDLVMVYEKNLLATIKKMTADQYFSGIDQIRLDNPEFLAIWRWEIVPGQVGNFSLSPEKDAWGIVLFGDYQSPGDHRASVGAFSAISVFVENKDFRLKQETEPLSDKIVAAVPVPLSTPLNTRSPVPPEEPPELPDAAFLAQEPEEEASSSESDPDTEGEPNAETESDASPSSEEAPAEEAPAGEESS